MPSRAARALAVLGACLLASSLPARDFTGRYRSDDAGLSVFVQPEVEGAVEGDFDGNGSIDIAMCGTHRGTANSTVCWFLPPLGTAAAGSQVHATAPAVASVTLSTGFLGRQLAAGDLNGDGHADFVATVDSRAPANAYVFFGPFAPGSTRSASGLDGTNGFALRLASLDTTRSSFDGGVAVLDFDGDGVQDLAVGQPDQQRVLVVLGRAAWPAVVDLRDDPSSVPDVHVIAPVQPPRFRVQRLVADDLDRDGMDDLMIVDAAADRLHILFGNAQPSSAYDTRAIAGTDGRTLAVDGLRDGAASADVNADGVPDLAFSTTSGVYVLFGGPDRTWPGPHWPELGTDGYLYEGMAPGYLEAIPDLDGDGRDDLAYTDPVGSGSRARVLFGHPNGGIVSGCFNGAMGFALDGPSLPQLVDRADLWPGERLFGLRDLDGDGRGDLVIRGRVIFAARLRIPLADGFGAPCG